MAEPILICNFNEALISKLRNRALIISTDDFNPLHAIQKAVSRSNRLQAVLIRTDQSLSSIDFRSEWAGIPLAVYAPDFGEYKDFIRRLPVIRKLNIRIFLSAGHENNYTSLKILSSLKIPCGLYFDDIAPDWELMNDLMHYAIYGKAAHAPVEPFSWLASNYEPAAYTDYDMVYFNDPEKYFYLSDDGLLALNSKALRENDFVGGGVDALEHIKDHPKYQTYINRRYDIMLRMDPCAFCPSFRICLGKFGHLAEKEETCKPFFADLMDAADHFRQAQQNKERKVWQL